MNNLLLIHVGCEVILLGGMAFYFQTQISGLKKQVAELKTQNGELIEAVNNINDQMEVLYKQLNVMFTQQQNSNSNQKESFTTLNDLQNDEPPQRNLKPKAPVPKQLNKPVPKQTNKPMPQMNKPVLNKKQKPKKETSISGSEYETLDEQDLDKELQQEYKELEECEGGVCKIK